MDGFTPMLMPTALTGLRGYFKKEGKKRGEKRRRKNRTMRRKKVKEMKLGGGVLGNPGRAGRRGGLV